MFYVYVYRDPRPNKNNAPVYVGKGQDETDRAMVHWQKPARCHNPGLRNLLLQLQRDGLEPVIQILETFKTEQAAFNKETELIGLFGRRDLNTGTLFNLTEGGEGLANIGEETLARRSAAIKKAHSTPESREVNRRTTTESWKDPKVRKARLASIHKNAADPEFRAKLSKSILESHSNPEVIAKISEASKDNWKNEEYRAKRAASLNAAIAKPGHKEKRGSATKAGWQDAETRVKRIAGIKASRTPELRAQISASCTALWDETRRAELSNKMKEVLNTPETKAAKSAAAKLAWARRKALANPEKVS